MIHEVELADGMLIKDRDTGGRLIIRMDDHGYFCAETLAGHVECRADDVLRRRIRTGQYEILDPHPKLAPGGFRYTSALPTDRQARKNIPLFSGLIKYFPDALAAVAELSRTANDFHNPGQPLHWDRSKSSDDHDALCRHLWEAGAIDSSDGVRHSVKVAWRALAALQKELETKRDEAKT